MADPIVNFFKSTLVGTYSNTDTSFTIATGDGALLPDPAVDGAYNLTIFRGLQVNANTTFEIVRVTAKSGDVLTVTREQEGTTALTINSEVHSILMSATKKTFDDIRTDIDNVPLPNQTLNTTDDVTFNSVDVTSKLVLPIRSDFPASPSQGEMFYHTTSQSMVFYDGEAFQQIKADFLIQLGLAEVTATANGMTLTVSQDIGFTTATASANNATTAFLSSAFRSLELAEATSSGLDAIMSFLTTPFTAWATTSSYPRTITLLGMSGDKSSALGFNGQDGNDGGLTYVASWNGSSWATTTSSPSAGHQLNLQHIGSGNDTMFTNRYIGNSNYPGNTYQWNGSSWASTTSSPQSQGQMRTFGTTSDAIFHRVQGDSGTRQTYFYNGSSFSTTSTLSTDNTSVVFSGPDSSEGITAGVSVSYVWNGSSWATTTAYSYNYSNGIGSSQGTNSVIGSSGSNAWPPSNHDDSALWNGTTWATTSTMNEGRTYANGCGGDESTVITTGGGYYTRRNSCEVTV